MVPGHEPKLGDLMVYGGRSYVVRGFVRRSHVDDQYVHLEDPRSGEWLIVDWPEPSGAEQDPPES